MSTLVVTHKDTDEILQVQPNISKPEVGLVLINNMELNADDYICQVIDGHYTPNKFKLLYVVSGGVISERMKTLDGCRSELLSKLSRQFALVCEGTDPATGKGIYVDCVIAEGDNAGTYRMDAGKSAAMTFGLALLNCEKYGITELEALVDFYDAGYTNFPVTDANIISGQQVVDAERYYYRKQELRAAIKACTTVEDVQAIEITWPVRVE